jgi:hypothetical protein
MSALRTAVSLAAAGDLPGAERIMATVTRYPANTAGWELELAGDLVQVAFQLRQNGNFDSSAQVARLTLQHVDRCVSCASGRDSHFAGSALDLAGLVDVRFFGDTASAEASYRRALVISPNLSSARSALGRLLDARDSEQRKLQGWGRSN